jgi:CRISPR/Cas system-associated exonuclease Cas4 (RecB family)
MNVEKFMSKIKSWSYSQLSDYEACAHAWMYRRIVKLPEPPSYHLIKGNAVHKLAEEYLLGSIEVLPPVLNKFANEFANLKKFNAAPEEEFVLGREWNHILNGWDSDEAWLRLKLDARIGSYIVDFKTGKMYPAHIKQAQLYADVMLMLYPEYAEVEVEFWYLNLGEIKSWVFTRDGLDERIALWERRVEKMHSDTSYQPTPHEWCRNCYVKDMCKAYD